MRHVLFYILVFISSNSISAQEVFSVKFELIKPTGKIDSTSYFRLSLTNISDSTYILIKGSRDMNSTLNTYLRSEIEWIDGTTKQGNRIPSFDFKNKTLLLIKPRATISTTMPIFISNEEGVLPRNESTLNKISRIRFILEKFKFINKDNPLKKEHTTNLTSNWVSLDPEALEKLLRWKR